MEKCFCAPRGNTDLSLDILLHSFTHTKTPNRQVKLLDIFSMKPLSYFEDVIRLPWTKIYEEYFCWFWWENGVQPFPLFPVSAWKSRCSQYWFWLVVTHLYSPNVSSLFWRSKSISFFSLSLTVRRKKKKNTSATHFTSRFTQIVDEGVPAYFPPLLRLMRQRMRRIKMRSTMALMSPINQPWVANRPGSTDGTVRRK